MPITLLVTGINRDPAGIRTQDPILKRDMLYQLSYRILSDCGCKYSLFILFCNTFIKKSRILLKASQSQFTNLFLSMNIFIIGFMGSGKSTVGKKIAARLGFSFLDMDREIEKIENKSISIMFKESGENYFREKETKWLENLSCDNHVISTGGGSPCFGNNMELMKARGKVVFLNASPGVLASRLFNGGTERPLLEKYVQNKEQLENYISLKLNERLPVYQKADLIVDSADLDSKRLNELADALIK